MRLDLTMKQCLNIIGLCVLVYSLLAGIAAVPAVADMRFEVVLNSKQEVSHAKQSITPRTSDGTGQAQLTYHTDSKKVCYTLRFEKLLGKEMEVHVHAPSPEKENSPVLFFIAPQESGGPSPIGSPKKGCIGPLNKQELRWLKRGRWYVNIHTDKFPGGEIRGQVLKASDQSE